MDRLLFRTVNAEVGKAACFSRGRSSLRKAAMGSSESEASEEVCLAKVFWCISLCLMRSHAKWSFWLRLNFSIRVYFFLTSQRTHPRSLSMSIHSSKCLSVEILFTQLDLNNKRTNSEFIILIMLIILIFI